MRSVLSAVLVVGLCSLAVTHATRFAVVGDYGDAGAKDAANVANLVKGKNPEFVASLGDNCYGKSTMDQCVGKYYAKFIHPYNGSYGPGAATNEFWPALGNHDYTDAGLNNYLAFFTLPGNERYYDVVQGNVHLFAVNSNPQEPDGTSSTSVQANWLKSKLASSTAPHRIVYFHHPPYHSGDTHPQAVYMRWPFKAWGATVVMSGHVHLYERLQESGLTYIVNGAGGRKLYKFKKTVSGSIFRWRGFGGMIIDANATHMDCSMLDEHSKVIDHFVLNAH